MCSIRRTTDDSLAMSGGLDGDRSSSGGFPMAAERSWLNTWALFESTTSSRPRLVAATRSIGSSICSGMGGGAGAATSAAAPGSLLLITCTGFFLVNYSARRDALQSDNKWRLTVLTLLRV